MLTYDYTACTSKIGNISRSLSGLIRRIPSSTSTHPTLAARIFTARGCFSKQDFTTLRDQLAGVKGKFIMSINNAQEIRDLFKDFHIMEVGTKYTLSSKGTKSVTELLISNFKLR